MPAAHDVVVIGGGAVGAACARELAVLGRRPLVLDPGAPGGLCPGCLLRLAEHAANSANGPPASTASTAANPDQAETRDGAEWRLV